MNTDDHVIRTQGLSKTFGEVEALKNLDLQVPQKTIFAFLGPNGAGKTTTIKLLLGLIRPTNGGGTVFGRTSCAKASISGQASATCRKMRVSTSI